MKLFLLKSILKTFFFSFYLELYISLMIDKEIGSIQKDTKHGLERKIEESKIRRIWESQSLDSQPTEGYTLSLPVSVEEKSTKGPVDDAPPTPEELPEPKITKINTKTFCISLNNKLTVFCYCKLKKPSSKKPQSFAQSNQFNFNAKINFVVGNDTNYIYVIVKDEIYVMEFHLEVFTESAQCTLKEKHKIEVKNLKFLSFVIKPELTMIVLSNDRILKYDVNNDWKLIGETKLFFDNPKDEELFNSLKSLYLLNQFDKELFFFGRRVDSKKKAGRETQSKAEEIFLAEIVLSEEKIKPVISVIDHVFDLGIFTKSKIFLLNKRQFLMSMHEEIIVIKRHFSKYVVWDNISVAASKSAQRKGQLVLADKIVFVYSEANEITANNIFFPQPTGGQIAKLDYPRIDSFRGTDNEEEILYDALVLQLENNSFTKLLFYFKEVDVKSAGDQGGRKRRESKAEEKATTLTFTLLCINQSDPEVKLRDLLRTKKPPDEIEAFVKRFKISELVRSKSQWEVSDKSVKDIEDLLMEIKDNKYIQNELTLILKASPHDLKFLSTIQNKQIERYKQMLINKLLKRGEQQNTSTDNINPEEIRQIIIWVLQSIMFHKKLQYSQSFLKFKEYDFIEIGKLKAASLKEEVKLLSCKGFQKRLKYFLNHFKYMALDNFAEIFKFLIDDKNVKEIQMFFTHQFPFILPHFEEPCQVFKKKHNFSLKYRKGSFNAPNFAMKESKLKDDDKQQCKLWYDQFGDTEEIKRIQTKQSFQQDIFTRINQEKKSDEFITQATAFEAVQLFEKIWKQFTKENWFIKNKSKQHSILNKEIDELKEEFNRLNLIGVFHILVQFLYEKVENKIFNESEVLDLLNSFAAEKLIPESFKQNIIIRKSVHQLFQNELRRLGISLKSKMGFPARSDFFIWDETQYFKFIFENFSGYLLKNVKDLYDNVLPGFFQEKFQIFLRSKEVQLSEIIQFLDQFDEQSDDKIRTDIFNCIKNLLKLSDKKNASRFMEILMDKQILEGENMDEQQDLIEQAKVAFGIYFYNFFEFFQLPYTYKDLIDFSNQEDYDKNQFIQKIMDSYCEQNFRREPSNQDEQKGMSEQYDFSLPAAANLSAIDNLNIHQSGLDFFSIMLYMIDTIRFTVEDITIFQSFIRLHLEQGKYEKIAQFIDQLNLQNYEEGQDAKEMSKLVCNFKEKYQIGEQLTQCFLTWIECKYVAITDQSFFNEDFFDEMFSEIQDGFKELEKILVGNQQKREYYFFLMLKSTKKLNPRLLNYVIPLRYKFIQIKENESFHCHSGPSRSPLLQNVSGFLFMMRLVKQMPEAQFEMSGSANITNDLYSISLVYQQFKKASSYRGENEEEQQFEENRFNNQFCRWLIDRRYYSYALQALRKILHPHYYFYDVLFQFLAQVDIPGANREQQLKQFVRQFIQLKAKPRMEVKIRQWIEKNLISRFNTQTSKVSIEIIFASLLESKRLNQAFYFLIRTEKMSVSSGKSYAIRKKFKEQTVCALSLLTSHIKCLTNHLYEEFYPTFSFFIAKYEILVDQFDRKDMIKDINIALSRLKEMISEKELEIKNLTKEMKSGLYKEKINSIKQVCEDEEEQLIQIQNAEKQMQQTYTRNHQNLQAQKKKIQTERNELEELYKEYMNSIGLDPTIKLNQLEKAFVKTKDKMEDRFIPKQTLGKKVIQERPEILRQQEEDLQSTKRLIERNKLMNEKTQEIKRNNKFEQIAKQAHQKANEVAKLVQKNQEKQFMINQKKKSDNIQQMLNQYKKCGDEERSEISSMRESYVSKAKQQTQKMLQKMRSRRNDIKKKSRISDIRVGQEFIESMKNPTNQKKEEQIMPLDQVRKSEKKDNFIPVTFLQHDRSASNTSQIQRQLQKTQLNATVSDYLSDLKSQMRSKVGSQHASNSEISYKSMIQLFNQREPQCRNLVEKLENIHSNLDLAASITQNIYKNVKRFDLFIKFLGHLFEYNPKFKTVIEEKAYKIAAKTISIDSKINLKELFPAQMFIKVKSCSMKQYHQVAYKMMNPSLRKVMRKPETNIHGLAILFRFGFDSDNKFYYKVYEDYLSVTLKEYLENLYNQKQIFILVERIRTLFTNLNPENRAQIFVDLLKGEVRQDEKRKALVTEIIKVLQRRKQILSGESNAELENLLKRVQ